VNLRRGIFRVVFVVWVGTMVLWGSSVCVRTYQLFLTPPPTEVSAYCANSKLPRAIFDLCDDQKQRQLDWKADRAGFRLVVLNEGLKALLGTVALWGAYGIGLWIVAGFKSQRG
jgi:hypothetical protein